MDKLLSITELSEILGITRSTIYKLVSAKKIPYLKIGARVLFDEECLKEWTKSKAIEPTAAAPRRIG